MNILWRTHEFPEGVPISSRYFEAFASTKKKVEIALKKLRQNGHIFDISKGARKNTIRGARKTTKFETSLYLINTSHSDYLYMMGKTRKGARKITPLGADLLLRGPKSPSSYKYKYSYGDKILSEREEHPDQETKETKETGGNFLRELGSQKLPQPKNNEPKKNNDVLEDVAEFFLS